MSEIEATPTPDEETPAPDSAEAEVQIVGYKHPPKHSQFKKGQSGNPGGRRRMKEGTFRDVIEDALNAHSAGSQMSVRDRIVAELLTKAMYGNERLMELLLREFE